MWKRRTLRMAASTLLAFSCGVALAAGPGITDRSLSSDVAAGSEVTALQVTAITEKRVRLPRPRKVPSHAPSEIVRAQVSADPGEGSTHRGAPGDAHDRYANAETGHVN